MRVDQRLTTAAALLLLAACDDSRQPLPAPPHAAFMEDEVGSLESGKRADFILLDADPFTVPEAEIHRIRVLEDPGGRPTGLEVGRNAGIRTDFRQIGGVRVDFPDSASCPDMLRWKIYLGPAPDLADPGFLHTL